MAAPPPKPRPYLERVNDARVAVARLIGEADAELSDVVARRVRGHLSHAWTELNGAADRLQPPRRARRTT